MKWRGRRQSRNVNDRRGSSYGGGGRRPLPRMAIGGGLGGGGLIILLIILLLTRGGPFDIFNNSSGAEHAPQQQGSYQESSLEKERREFLSVVLAETEDAWHTVFDGLGEHYHEPQLTLFTGHVRSACGTASSAVGPFYCGNDQNIYIDLDFFDEMQHQLGAGGDFAMAYVLAHEVGHHVQNELGVLDQVNQLRRRVSETEANDLTVRLELQADYLAGVWGHYAEEVGILEEGDIAEAIRATEAPGDDTLQKKAQGYVVPDSFTHGTSEQRTRWFLKGFKAGDLSGWDTFSAASSRELYAAGEDELPGAAPQGEGSALFFTLPDLEADSLKRLCLPGRGH